METHSVNIQKSQIIILKGLCSISNLTPFHSMVLTLFVSPSVAARPTTRKDLILSVFIIILGLKLPAGYSTIQVQGQTRIYFSVR